MTLISIIVTLVIVGLILWAVEQLPIDAKIKLLIRVVVILFVIVWLLQALGVFTGLNDLQIGR